jgi:hypothetical protein
MGNAAARDCEAVLYERVYADAPRGMIEIVIAGGQRKTSTIRKFQIDRIVDGQFIFFGQVCNFAERESGTFVVDYGMQTA